MQKLADGHDTDTVSSLAWLWSRWAAAPQAGPVLDCAVLDCAVLDCAVLDCAVLDCAAVDGAAGDDPSHPMAAPVSRTNAHASPGLARLILFACLVSTVLGPNAGPRPMRGHGLIRC